MSKLEEAIQYHVDNNLGSISAKYKKYLSKNELEDLKKVIKLQSRLDRIRVSESFGKNSLKNTLINLEVASQNEHQKHKFSSFRIASMTVSVFALVLLLGGFGFSITNKTKSKTPSDTISALTSDGSLNSVNNINMMDVEAEQSQLQVESKSVSNVKVDLASTSNISEAINENF